MFHRKCRGESPCQSKRSNVKKSLACKVKNKADDVKLKVDRVLHMLYTVKSNESV